MTLKLIELLGEQPILNLLPIRYLQPDEVLFMGTRATHDVSQHLQRLVEDQMKVHQTTVHNPYDPPSIHADIERKIHKLGWSPGDIIYDLSGGNKMMAFAAYQSARDGGSRVADLENIRHRYRLRLYEFDGHLVMKEDVALPGVISIADYLNAHLPGFEEGGFSRDKRGRTDVGGHFEETIYSTLAPHVDEIMAGVRPAGVAEQIEIDMIVRRGNAVGIIEAKTGVKKAGIDQLDTAGNPHYLGEYLVKFLVTGRYLPRSHKVLASVQEIHVVEMPGYEERRGIPERERQALVRAVQTALSGR